MSAKKGLSRITIDLSEDCHKKLKAKSALSGRSMREVVVELIDQYLKFNTKSSSCGKSN